MASRDLQVEMLPHLRHCYPELRERCNLEIVVEGTRIPLHVDILSKECSVFAKFFSAFDSSGDTSMGAAVTQLFQGADLPAALLTFLVVYKPDIFTLIQVFYGHTWGGGSAEEYGLPEIDCALLQRTFKLLDMIDARDVLDTLVNKMPTVVGTMVRADSVGWLETCGALEPAIRDHAVDHILQCIMNCPKESAGHVIGGRWADVPHPALLLLFEAMVRIARQGPHPDFWHIQNWRAMGDLYCGIFEDDEPSKWLQLSMRAFDAVTRPPMTLEEARVYLPRLVNEANGKPLVDWMIKVSTWHKLTRWAWWTTCQSIFPLPFPPHATV